MIQGILGKSLHIFYILLIFPLVFYLLKKKTHILRPPAQALSHIVSAQHSLLCKLVFSYLLSQCEYTRSLALTTDPIVTTT